jgi:hypothetical protein
VATTRPRALPLVTSVPACTGAPAALPTRADSQRRCAQQRQVGRHAVALGQQHQVALDQFAPGDALRPAVADHQRTRRRDVTQGHQ